MSEPTPIEPASSQAKKRSRTRILVAIAVLGAFSFCCVPIGLRLVVFETFAFEGPSMEPAIADGDRVIVWKLAGDPSPSDVIVIRSPADEVQVMKRVIGVAGDTIEIVDDVVHLNGSSLEDVGARREVGPFSCSTETLRATTYTVGRSLETPPSNHPPVTVPEGHLYVLGDHRDRSNDSRYFGTVPLDDVVGIVGPHYFTVDERGPCASR